MVDRQFSSTQNGPGPINPIAVIPTGTEPNKWIDPEIVEQSPTPTEGAGKKITFKDNLTTVDRVVLCCAELVGTAILVYLGCMGCALGMAGGSIPHEQISFTFGLAVMISVQVFGHISGSHINPAVTVAAATMGKLPLIQIPIYLTGQFLGAFAGFGLLKLSTPSQYMIAPNGHGICSPGLNPDISVWQGFLVEFTVTFILAIICCGVWDYRNRDKEDSVAIKFGLTIAVLAMAAGPYTGANMNPARSLAPALFNGDWSNHWVYWLGPLLGAFVASLLYRFVFDKEPPQEEIHPEGTPLTAKA